MGILVSQKRLVSGVLKDYYVRGVVMHAVVATLCNIGMMRVHRPLKITQNQAAILQSRHEMEALFLSTESLRRTIIEG